MTDLVIPTPLTVEILDCSEEQDGSELIVWLASRTPEGKLWYLTTMSEPVACRLQVELVAAAFRSLLGTSQGEAQALAYAQHVLSQPCDHDDAESCDHDDTPPGYAPLGSPRAVLVAEFIRAITRG